MKRIILTTSLIMISSTIIAESEYEGGPITTNAIEFGATSCLAEIRSVDKFLNDGSANNGAWTAAATNETEERLYSALNIIKYSGGSWGYTTLSINPGGGNCDGTLTRISTFPNESCNLVRETKLDGYEYSGELAGKAIYESGTTKVVLEDLTGSCIAIRYETLFPVPR